MQGKLWKIMENGFSKIDWIHKYCIIQSLMNADWIAVQSIGFNQWLIYLAPGKPYLQIEKKKNQLWMQSTLNCFNKKLINLKEERMDNRKMLKWLQSILIIATTWNQMRFINGYVGDKPVIKLAINLITSLSYAESISLHKSLSRHFVNLICTYAYQRAIVPIWLAWVTPQVARNQLPKQKHPKWAWVRDLW